MKKIVYISFMVILGLMTACESLDVPPKNILTDDDIFNEGGIKAYMAGMYNRLPMDDFNVSNDGDKGGYFNWNCIMWPMLSTGETVNQNSTGLYIPAKGYWTDGYQVIRSANYLIEKLPAYVDNLHGAEAWIGEAKFVRAYVYFQLVKRYGGMPIIEKTQEATSKESDLWVARSSHQDSYDFILKDLTDAIESMGEKSEKGRANKYVAAAFKSRVALFAASIARYGGTYSYTVDNVQLCGIPAEKANDYYKQAWDAAKVLEGKYSLYNGDSDLEENYANIFVKADNSSESVFIRQYDFSNYVHSFDAVYSPPRMTSTYGGRYNVTLDWVELFDGLPIDSETGRLKTTDNNGNYITYNGPEELFEKAEPRLRASILLPGHTYKGVEVDIRRGIINESVDPSTPIQKFVADDGSTTTAYTSSSFFNANVLTTTEPVLTQKPYELSDGTKLNKNGLDGPSNGSTTNTLTGFHGRKWLNLNLTPSATKLHESFQTWIDIRYAEVLLNRAEAALELAQNGVGAYNGANMQSDAFECINQIRSRAGATLLTSAAELSAAAAMEKGKGQGGFIVAPNRGIQLVRIERYKELAFEHKLYWDLRRWFTFDKQIYNYKRRMLNPFLFAKGATLNSAGNPQGKYIYDARVAERANNNLTFQTKYYYEAIPGGQIKTNPLLEQNNQY